MIDSGQLPLGLHWPAWQRFEHFEIGANALALAACERICSQPDAPWLYLHGPRGSGKTHLLLATCQSVVAAGEVAQYLGLRELAQRSEAIRGQGGGNLVALDDIDVIAGDDEAEYALFDLYNRCRAEGTHILLGAAVAPTGLGIRLPDLASRLGAMTRLPLQPLDETARRALLRQRAAMRGMVLDDAVLDWVFRNHPRDLGSLTQLLDKLDRASLVEHRRITVPFLRKWLGEVQSTST